MKSLSSLPYRHIAKRGGCAILGFLVFFIIFAIYLNYQDLGQLDIKNSSRRKIENQYSDENINQARNKFFLHRQNEKLKKYRGSFVQKNKLFDVSEMKNNIKNYKKKIKKKKITD